MKFNISIDSDDTTSIIKRANKLYGNGLCSLPKKVYFQKGKLENEMRLKEEKHLDVPKIHQTLDSAFMHCKNLEHILELSI